MNKFKKIISIIVVVLMVVITVPTGSVKAATIDTKYNILLTKTTSWVDEWFKGGGIERIFKFYFVADSENYDSNAKYYYCINEDINDITDLSEIKTSGGRKYLTQNASSNYNYSLEYTVEEQFDDKTLYLHVLGASADGTKIGNSYTYPFNYISVDSFEIKESTDKAKALNYAQIKYNIDSNYWGGYNIINNMYLYTDLAYNTDYYNKYWEKGNTPVNDNTECLVGTNNKDRMENKIKVLNVHPNCSDGTNSSQDLKKWMETTGKFYTTNEDGTSTEKRGYGRGGIEVTLITLSDFNNKVSVLDLNKYDVIAFGTWDGNGGTPESEWKNDIVTGWVTQLEDYIKSGKGIIFGHDTACNANTNFANVAKFSGLGIASGYTTEEWRNKEKSPFYYQGTTAFCQYPIGYSSVQIVKNSIFTKYPWVVGNVDNVLQIPICHTLDQYITINSESFLKFYNPSYSQMIDSKWNDYNSYLSVSKKYKTAMIQTGHSNCQSTIDERQIWANLIYYLAQKQVNNELNVNLYDSVNPKVPSFKGNPSSDDTNKKITFNLNDGKDIDEDFMFYLRSNNSILTDSETSNSITMDYQSGFDHFEYYIDEIEASKEDITSATSITSTSIDYNYSDSDCGKTKYIHVRAVDKEGNKSDFATKSFTIKSNEGTVIVKYVDTNGSEIATSSTITGKIGDAYTTSSKSISGYTLVSTPSNATGIIKEDTITVIYRYSKDETHTGGLTLTKNPNLTWTNGNVTISAKASFSGKKVTGYDEETGIFSYEYNYVKSITGLGTTTNFTPNSYTRTTTRTATSNNTYSFSATGKLSSASASIKVVEIDKDKPAISGYPSENWTKDDVNLNIKLTDSTSGVLNAKLTGNILPVSTKSWSATTPGSTVSTKTEYYKEKIGTEGRHNYNIEVTDNATNSESGSFKLNIDKTAPTITGTVGDKFNNKDIDLEEGGDYSIISEDIPIKINALDELSGVKEFKLYETDKNFANEKEIKNSTISNKDSYPEKENGDIEYHLKANSDYEGYGYHYYVAKAVDEVGNESEIKFKIYFRPEIELLGLTNTYRVPFINQLITERVPGPVTAPLKILSGVKIGMEVDFKGADIAEVEFYKNGNTKINGIKFESSDSTLVTYNKTLATKYVASDWTNGDNSSDNKVSMLVNNPDKRNKTHFDFILPNKGVNACKHGDIISMKVILYSKEKYKINIELGNKFFYIQDDIEQQLTINNIR